MKVVLFMVFSCVYVEHHIIIFLYHTKLTVKTVVIYGVYYGSRASSMELRPHVTLLCIR